MLSCIFWTSDHEHTFSHFTSEKGWVWLQTNSQYQMPPPGSNVPNEQTNYMEQNLSWTNWHSASHEMSRPLWNPKVHVLSQMNSFHNFPTLMSTYRCLCRSKESVQFRGPAWHFVICSFLRWGNVSPSSNPQAGAPPLRGCQQLLIQYIRKYPPHLQPATRGRAMPRWQGPA
jgi:hypothetical protein